MKKKTYFLLINKSNKHFFRFLFLNIPKLILFTMATHIFIFGFVSNAMSCSQNIEDEKDIISEAGEKRKRSLSEGSMPLKKKQKSLKDFWVMPSTSKPIMNGSLETITTQDLPPRVVDEANIGTSSSKNYPPSPITLFTTTEAPKEVNSILFPDHNKEGLYDLKISLLTVESWDDALNEKARRSLYSRRASAEASTPSPEDTEESGSDEEDEGDKREIRKFDVTFKDGDISYRGLVLWETIKPSIRGWVNPLKKFLITQEALKEEEVIEEGPPKADHSALLFIEMPGRNFVGIIGQGRHLLNPNVRDSRFALRASVNGCDPEAKEAIKSIGITIPGSNPSHSYTVYDRGASAQDMRIASGVRSLRKIDVNKRNPDDSIIRIKASGSSVSLQRRVSIDDFPKLCQAFLELSQSDRYKDTLPWIDALVSVDDTTLLEKLEQELLKRIADANNFEWGLASPHDGEEYSENPTVSYEMSKESYQTTEDIMKFIRGASCTKKSLKEIKIKSLDSEGNKLNTWNVYHGILMEVNYEADIYTFNQGKWYKIKQSDYEQIKKDVDRFFVDSSDDRLNFLTPLKPNSKELFEAKPKENISKSSKKTSRKQTKKEASKPKYGINEGVYSRRICEENPDQCLLMDARNAGINIGSEREKDVIELCDILTMSKYLITIKNWTGSSTFSHLLNQAVVPSQTIEEPKFRISTKDQYVKAQIKEQLKRVVGDIDSKKVMQDFTNICNECDFAMPDRDQVIRDKLMEYINDNFNGRMSKRDIAAIEKRIEADQKTFETILPSDSYGFNSKDYTFVYGFFHEKECERLSQYLPYFSLMALHNALVKLTPKYNVLIKRIPIPALH